MAQKGQRVAEQWTIRPYKDSDFARLCDIHDAARQDELAAANLSDAFIPMRLAADNEGLFDYTVCVAEQDGTVSGFVAYSADELAWLYVDPAQYRRGVGTALTRHMLAATNGPVSIEVLQGNRAALDFYKAMGFREVTTETGSMVGNETFTITAHILARD